MKILGTIGIILSLFLLISNPALAGVLFLCALITLFGGFEFAILVLLIYFNGFLAGIGIYFLIFYVVPFLVGIIFFCLTIGVSALSKTKYQGVDKYKKDIELNKDDFTQL